jgi:hypothetical protein
MRNFPVDFPAAIIRDFSPGGNHAMDAFRGPLSRARDRLVRRSAGTTIAIGSYIDSAAGLA